LLGPNGCGKSTLIRMLLGEMEPDAGMLKVGSNVKVGYLSQQAWEGDKNLRVIDMFRQVALVTEPEARHLLARFLFYGEHVFKRVGQLSGGERMRLRLAQMMHQEINLLVLDEPTNHLDIEARETLEEALADFKGSLFIVSHDRYFLQKMADGVFWVEDRQLVHDVGTYEEAREKRRNRQAARGKIVTVEKPVTQREPESVRQTESPKRPNLYKLADLEQKIAFLEKERDEIIAHLSTGDESYQQLLEWQQQSERLQQQIDAHYESWLEMQNT
jgi:ABC-type multidrug transport system ATPase subunit